MNFFSILLVLIPLFGSLLILISALGMLKFPDTYCRSHALAKAMPLGLNLILVAAWLQLGTDAIGFKTLLAILFQTISIPVSGHLIALLSFEKDLPRYKQKQVQEL